MGTTAKNMKEIADNVSKAISAEVDIETIMQKIQDEAEKGKYVLLIETLSEEVNTFLFNQGYKIDVVPRNNTQTISWK